MAIASSSLSFCMERWLLEEPIITIEAERPTRTKSTTKTKRIAEVGPTNETKFFYAPFRFFDLPRELRDMIYDKVWPETPRKEINTLNPSARIDLYTAYRKKNQMKFTTMKQYRMNYVSTYQSYWSLVSKKFLSEANAQYFRRVEWYAGIPGSHFSTFIHLSSSKYTIISHISMTEEMEFLLAGKNDLTYGVKSRQLSRTILKVSDSPPIDLSILKKLQPSLSGADHQRTLYITFGVVSNRCQDFRDIDLSGLLTVGFELDKLVVEVTCTKTEDAELVNRTYGLLNREIRRLASVMIGSTIVVKHTKVANNSYGQGIRRVFEVTKA